ncbi:type II toxin-antitoxin system RelB/DinJ family antitoxin [Candidatus Saccharibacteria bacterium]|nr:type II toxin-antitoxin system RelB/DinJ family antitoxin [Candidatus Saccharibacteria bacterium]
MSTTIPTQIRIDVETKREASALFRELGIDMSGAVNMFLRQCVLRQGMPFEVKMPEYKKEVLEAMEEAKQLAHDPNAETYKTFEEYQEAMRRYVEDEEQ